MSVCSSGVGFINSHSSRIRSVGLEYLDNTFLYVPFSLAVLKLRREREEDRLDVWLDFEDEMDNK